MGVHVTMLTVHTYRRGCTKGVAREGRGHKNTHSYRVSVIFILKIYLANFDGIKTVSLH